ncbi:hypothetical protein O181_008092 [Austropuccinia psidii MF-1]|uniref:Reverse transcriptase Ty1/copia-type domain-containing protein n=1 Tax=Austropuccinia psidii MF-1 TaxID=1389203 RepID=A0A9Q3BP22_9BASI|nr:hypothetical protein [Austropuccinia psidii MF-1]
MVDEVNAEEFYATKNSNKPTVPCIKVIGPHHPIMIHSEINDINILTYSRREKTHLKTVDKTPCTYQATLKTPEKHIWLASINRELYLMKKLGVWELVQLQESYKLIGIMWVFKIKNNPSSGISEYKAQLCTRGLYQTQGIDYGKTYAPTRRLKLLRTLIDFSVVHSSKFHQIDIKSAFINAPLSEEVYLKIPQGLDVDKQNYCLKLNKAIHRLKQAPLAWYKCLKDWLISVKLNPLILDPCVIHRKTGPLMRLYLHLDDIGIFGKNVTLFKKQIATRFEMKDLGEEDLNWGKN